MKYIDKRFKASTKIVDQFRKLNFDVIEKIEGCNAIKTATVSNKLNATIIVGKLTFYHYALIADNELSFSCFYLCKVFDLVVEEKIALSSTSFIKESEIIAFINECRSKFDV